MTSKVHPVDEVLPFGKLTALGLQHVLVMYAGAVAVPLIVGRALQGASAALIPAADSALRMWPVPEQRGQGM